MLKENKDNTSDMKQRLLKLTYAALTAASLATVIVGAWLMINNYGVQKDVGKGIVLLIAGMALAFLFFMAYNNVGAIPFRDMRNDCPPPPMKKLPDGREEIEVSGRHWGYIFDLPCILEISKRKAEDTVDNPFATLDCACCVWYDGHCANPYPTDDDCDEAHAGDKIIRLENGKWFIKKGRK